MGKLIFRSFLVLALLYGLLFSIGMVVVINLDLPIGYAIVNAAGVIALQWLLGPITIQWLFEINWTELSTVDDKLARFVDEVCESKNIPIPRFGLIVDGNPNAFTFGHYPGNARVVVTTGLMEKLDLPEREAIVAHELGHIKHWDFVLMTAAAIIPLLLYIIYRYLRRKSRGKTALENVALGSYIAYLVSQFVVLLLSRVREYYADEFAGEVTENPGALATGLVKVAYGLATMQQDKNGSNSRFTAARALYVFDPKMAQSLGLASAAGGGVSLKSMANAMKWDLWNPWAFFFELTSTHPLPAKRILALERQSARYGKVLNIFSEVKSESYWDEFLVDFFVKYLPVLGAGVSIILSSIVPSAMLSLPLVLGFGYWLQRRISYPTNFEETRAISSLIEEVKVSPIRSIPCTIEGKIIGRGIPGLFYSEDLALQDESGFIVVDYRQPIWLLEFLFGWLKADDLIGEEGKVMGWYRRAPAPHFEMLRFETTSGSSIRSYFYPVTQFLIYAAIITGLAMVAFSIM